MLYLYNLPVLCRVSHTVSLGYLCFKLGRFDVFDMLFPFLAFLKLQPIILWKVGHMMACYKGPININCFHWKYNSFAVFPIKLWTPGKSSGSFTVSRPIRCEMKPQKVTCQTAAGISHDLIWSNEVAFSSARNLQFSLCICLKKLFFTTNQHQSFDFVFSKPKLLNWPKSECKLWKFTTVQVRPMSKGFSATKKYGLKTTNNSQLAWPFELHLKPMQRKIACDWLIFLTLKHAV